MRLYHLQWVSEYHLQCQAVPRSSPRLQAATRFADKHKNTHTCTHTPTHTHTHVHTHPTHSRQLVHKTTSSCCVCVRGKVVCTHLVLDLPQPHVFTADLEMCRQKLIDLLQRVLAAERCRVRHVASRRRRRRRTHRHTRRTWHATTHTQSLNILCELYTPCELAQCHYTQKMLFAAFHWKWSLKITNCRDTVS